MIEYWNELTQGSQVAIIVAAIAGVAGILAALIRAFFRIGVRLAMVGLFAVAGLFGFDSFTFDELKPPVHVKTGKEKAPLFVKMSRDKILPY